MEFFDNLAGLKWGTQRLDLQYKKNSHNVNLLYIVDLTMVLLVMIIRIE